MQPNLVRGAVVLCDFPFETKPTLRGPTRHYCLFVDQCSGLDGSPLLIVAYGTSRLDEQMARLHTPGHGVLSVPSQFIKGSSMPGKVTHFLARHVALIPPDWVYPKFSARLDFIRPERRTTAHHAKLYQEFELFEDVMDLAADKAVEYNLATGLVGLPHRYSWRG
jgi:hypothetical protein